MSTKTTKKIIVGLGAVLILVVGIVLGTYWVRPTLDKQNENGAKAAATNVINDVTTNKLSEAYALTATKLQSTQTKEQFLSAMSNLHSSNPGYGTGQILHNADGSIVYIQTVSNMPKSSSGSTDATFYATVVKQSGSWKVSSLVVL